MAALCALLLSTAPLLPQSRGPFQPGQLELAGPGPLLGAELRDVQTCGACHPDVVAQWRTSAHAFASFNNPIYRVSIDRLRMERGLRPSRMCAACHDVALLTEGAMDAAHIEPEDPRAHAAITCQTCHSVVATRPDGNGSYTLSTAEVPLPNSEDPVGSLARHRAHVAPKPLRSAELCGACHRSFLDASTGNASAFFGMDDFNPWAGSAFSGSLAGRVDAELISRDCRACHMPPEAAPLGDASAKDGRVASHRFVGGHSWLAAMQHDSALVERYRRFLRGVASVDIAPGAALRDGVLRFDVVIRNLSVGHRFPGGVLDAQDTRLEVTVSDAQGRPIASDASHALRTEVLDQDGTPLKVRETHRFIATAWNRTLEPRGVQASKYQFEVPPSTALPLQVEVRLIHQSRNDALQRAACAESQTDLGQAYARASLRLNGVALDACAGQPRTEIASARLALPVASDGPSSALWERSYFHGVALASALQEHADEALIPLQRAWELAPDARAKARVAAARAALEGRQGRTANALDWCDKAQHLAPHHPAIERIRGQALAAVWRWNEAADAFARSAAQAPKDLESWRLLAVALGSAGRHSEALAAAQTGLQLQPRDADLLRVQTLALTAMQEPASESLLEALKYRAPDDGPAVRAACSKSVEGCASERQPVPTRTLKPATPPR